MNEREWVHALAPRLALELEKLKSPAGRITVNDGKKLPYSCEIREYGRDGAHTASTSSYETDLLISDLRKDGSWIPRVVVECKIGGSVTTHDALTYSSKAATHKHVHPYLRYGFLAAEREHYAIPPRLVKHGAYFDFMAAWSSAKPTKMNGNAFANCSQRKSRRRAPCRSYYQRTAIRRERNITFSIARWC